MDASTADMSAAFDPNSGQPLTYDSGKVRFDPAPADNVLTTTRQAAIAAWRKTGLYADADQYSMPQVWFALYSDYGSGTTDQSGKLTPTYSDRPAWVVRFTGVPDSASGGGRARGSAPAAQEKVLHDIVVVVDDAPGTVLVTMSDLPDTTAAPRAATG